MKEAKTLCFIATIRKISVASGYLREDFFNLTTKGEHPVEAVARLMATNRYPHFFFVLMWFSEIPEAVFIANQSVINNDVDKFTRTS